MSSIRTCCILATLCLGLCGCMQFNVLGAPGKPYSEHTLSGTGSDKILLLSVDGLITEHAKEGLLRSRPGTVEQLAAQLKLARKDKNIKAVVLKVDSPGGTTTASDIIYHELMAYKAESKAKLVVAMMGLAASGGYYIALPADHIAALPTTITGSVGVIFLRPRVAGLLDKIGVDVEVSKSGAQKDMGSPFRPATQEERRLFDGLVRDQATRFQNLVRERRKLDPAAMTIVSTARVFTAAEAKDLGLIDSIGYMEDAVAKAASLAGLPAGARVVTYRRTPAPNATYYQPGVETTDPQATLVNLGLEGLLPPRAGMYFLWTPGLAQ